MTVPETLETLTAPDVRRYSRTGNDYATGFQNLAHHGWVHQIRPLGLRVSANNPALLLPFVGTSSGLGLALVRRVLARGDRVIATARARAQAPALEEGGQEGQELEGRFAEALSSLSDERRREGEGEDSLRLLELDVSAPFAEVQRQAEAAIAVWGRVDVLVNNAGTVGREFGPSEELGCVALRCVLICGFFHCRPLPLSLSLSHFLLRWQLGKMIV